MCRCPVDCLLHEYLGLRARNKDLPIDDKRPGIEFLFSKDVSCRFLLRPSLQKSPEMPEFIIHERSVHVQVQIDPLDAQGMGQKEFRIEPGCVNALALKILP